MPEPFKNFISAALVDEMASHLSKAWPRFPREAFVAEAAHELDKLELKERSNQIVAALEHHLPDDFAEAAAILRASLPDGDKTGLSGWAILPLNDYVGRAGQRHFETAMDLLEKITVLFSSEFGIRYFLLQDQPRALAQMRRWSENSNHHVRRLASEGCRPRLPWAMRLPALMKDPAPILPILARLRDDPENYVRRSVANNLNDIAKDHPDLVARIAAQWMKDASESRKRLIRHACRTLLKQGHQGALEVFGFTAPKKLSAELALHTPTLTLGENLLFELTLESDATASQDLMIDYAVHHVKADGTRSPKVFKWKSLSLESGGQTRLAKKHAIRPITTRRYYPGLHHVEVIVNGQAVARSYFTLSL
ncbi:DNA alkylation repair protein [Denitrobaculum tricleocarpae]|uniref:DNA alkylation repair protein n=1 Tax=Denitrobaculum tricleocarpae TaxID=2591009 RepID=A0A545U2I6_9PROT|nr:DNA alkylation repair protein [Denitrobaculum tricleocarpae]TQV83687.1 DNA alkylation repair protein [Denitrobaculum tricleocarpae]